MIVKFLIHYQHDFTKFSKTFPLYFARVNKGGRWYLHAKTVFPKLLWFQLPIIIALHKRIFQEGNVKIFVGKQYLDPDSVSCSTL